MVKAGQYPGPQKRGGRKLDEITVVIANQRVSPVRVLKTGLGRLITGRSQRKLGLGDSPGQCMAQRLTQYTDFQLALQGSSGNTVSPGARSTPWPPSLASDSNSLQRRPILSLQIRSKK